MLTDPFVALEPIGSGRTWLPVMIWFVVAWILKVSVRQMAYFWLEIMLLVGNGLTGHQVGASWVWLLPGLN